MYADYARKYPSSIVTMSIVVLCIFWLSALLLLQLKESNIRQKCLKFCREIPYNSLVGCSSNLKIPSWFPKFRSLDASHA
jgi:hypothetical protein